MNQIQIKYKGKIIFRGNPILLEYESCYNYQLTLRLSERLHPLKLNWETVPSLEDMVYSIQIDDFKPVQVAFTEYRNKFDEHEYCFHSYGAFFEENES